MATFGLDSRGSGRGTAAVAAPGRAGVAATLLAGGLARGACGSVVGDMVTVSGKPVSWVAVATLLAAGTVLCTAGVLFAGVALAKRAWRARH